MPAKRLLTIQRLQLLGTRGKSSYLLRLQDTLTKYTNLDLDSYERQVLLREKFLSQSVPDIRKKLQNQIQANPNNSVEDLRAADTVFCGHDPEKEARAQEEEKET